MAQVRGYIASATVADPAAPYGWRYHQRKARSMREAEVLARQLHGQLGVEVTIRLASGGGDLALVRSDAMGRVWCDLEAEGARLL